MLHSTHVPQVHLQAQVHTSIDAARLLAAAAVAIMTPSKRPSVTIDCVGLGHAATTEVHRKSLCWLGPAANLVNGDVNTPILSGGAVALRDSMIDSGRGEKRSVHRKIFADEVTKGRPFEGKKNVTGPAL